MKIIIVSDYARIAGGAYKIAIASALAFAERGHEVEFFAGNAPVGPELAAAPRIKVTCLDDGPHSRDPKRLRGAMRGLYYRRAAREMRNVLSRCDRKDTVVHLHAYRETLTTSVAHAAIKMGFVTVYTAHEYTMGCPYGGFFDYRRNSVCPERGLSLGCLKTRCNTSGYGNKLWYYLAGFVYSKICRIPARLSHVVFISKLNQRVLLPYLPSGARHTIVPNAGDSDAAEGAKIMADSPFVFVGSLEPFKDPLIAARCARSLGAPIVFVGAGSLEGEIRNVNPGAVVTGWVGKEEVDAHLRQARALIFPSIWYEAQPCTTMEAAARGLPLIVSDRSAAVEQVELLGVGEVFKGGDASDLEAKMRPYLDADFARTQGKRTREAYAKLDFSNDLHVARLLDMYKSELARQS
ncbi:MAG: glycosyltransferase [Fimbriimonadales bacterium]